jgi:hypothetical protein
MATVVTDLWMALATLAFFALAFAPIKWFDLI